MTPDATPPPPYLRGAGKLWLLVSLCLLFTVGGLAMLVQGQVALGVSTLSMFGGGGAFFLYVLQEQARIGRHRGADVVVEAAAVPIPERKGRLVALASWLLVMGVSFTWAFHDRGLLPTLLGVGMALGAVGALLGVALGWLGNGSLQFTPAGLVVTQRRERYLVPWDDISSLHLFAWQEVPQIAVGLRDAARLLASVQPPSRAEAVRARLAQSAAWTGVPLFIAPARYGLRAEWLHTALVQYTQDRARRAELVEPAGLLEDRGGS